MKVRRTARQMALAFAVVILPLVLACGNDDGTDMEENPLVGTWSATSIVIDGVEVLAGTSLTFTWTFNSDDTYFESITGDTNNVLCDTTTSCTDDGTYIYTTMTFFICDPGCDEPIQYTISGNTLSIVVVDEEPDPPVTITATFVRV